MAGSCLSDGCLTTKADLLKKETNMAKTNLRGWLCAVLLLAATCVQASVNIIPKPTLVKEGKGSFLVTDGMNIGVNDPALADAADYLKQMIARATGFQDLAVRRGEGHISLLLQPAADPEDESYTLTVSSSRITIKAGTYRGVVNGISTLRQLLPDEIESREPVKGIRWTVPVVQVQDKPAYHWRGLMLDPSRHFYSVEETEQFLDHMALYKYNKFHWHLTDGVAWRLQINRYPLLTQRGAWREFRQDIDINCENRAKAENNPTLLIPQKYCREENGRRLYGGFYTQDDVRRVVRYAAIRGIDVIPEIDMPGHFWCGTQAYPLLSCGQDGNDPLCLGKDLTLEFCRNVWEEVFQLFPYEYAHIGGDEVDRSRWAKCPDCQRRIKALGLQGVEELQAWFTKDMEKFFNAHGRKLMGWDEILEGGVSKTATVYWWRGDHADVAQKSTEMGNEVVICPTTYCYFDYRQDDNTLKHIYTSDVIPADLTPKQLKLVKGIQSNAWGEFIPTVSRMQFMVFPRALAMVEKAWTPNEQQNWDNFSQRLQAHLHRLQAAGINYRPLQTTQP